MVVSGRSPDGPASIDKSVGIVCLAGAICTPECVMPRPEAGFSGAGLARAKPAPALLERGLQVAISCPSHEPNR
jgi:hypothetical protein